MLFRPGLICFLCIVLSLKAWSAIQEQRKPLLPVIPAFSYNILDEGAIANGETINTAAIQKALDKAKETGGSVLVPKGVFLCGPLLMYSKTNLVLAKGAVLKLINDIAGFPQENNRYLNFIHISGATDIKISGEGTIDGQGAAWWKAFVDKKITARRPQMLFIEKTTKVEIEGVTFLNPPNTHVSLKNTAEVTIHGITIQAPADSKNTDGLNISVRNCLIEQCTINTGDDNIAINFGNKSQPKGEPECRDITVRDCVFGYGHGLSIGSYTSGGLQNLDVHHCRFTGTTSAIRIKTARGRGGLVENLSYSDIEIRDSKWPIFISAYYPKEPALPEQDAMVAFDDKTPVYRNITLRNIHASGARDALKIWGLPESPIRNLNFSNVQVSAEKGIQMSYVAEAGFTHCSFINKNAEQPILYKADVKGL